MGNPHQRIIHHTRQMIRREAVGLENDEIVEILVGVDE
jgi:hypothetical protein